MAKGFNDSVKNVMAVYRYKCDLLLKHIPDLQCHKCKDVPGPNFLNVDRKSRYFCIDKSHALCENDKTKCPCGSVVGKIPSLIVTKLLQDLPWMCQNYKNGCREINKDIEELEHHHENCIFRRVLCPYFYCSSKVMIKNINTHMKIVHKNISDYKTLNGMINAVVALKNFNQHSIYSWEPRKITNDDGNVFYDATYYRDDTFYFWLYFKGSSNEAKNFACTYSIENIFEQKLSYTKEIHTLEESKEEIIASKSCFSLSRKSALRLLNEEKVLKVSISIQNVKNQVKEQVKDNDLCQVFMYEE